MAPHVDHRQVHSRVPADRIKSSAGISLKAESQHTLMLCSKMGLHGWGTAIASGIASYRHSRWFFVLHPSISA